MNKFHDYSMTVEVNRLWDRITIVMKSLETTQKILTSVVNYTTSRKHVLVAVVFSMLLHVHNKIILITTGRYFLFAVDPWYCIKSRNMVFHCAMHTELIKLSKETN